MSCMSRTTGSIYAFPVNENDRFNKARKGAEGDANRQGVRHC